MAVSFKVPKSPTRSIFNIDSFLGVDMTNNGTSVDDRMSPNAPNMIRDVPGKVRKRKGYKVVKDFGSGVIYGAHVLASTTTNTGDFVTNRNMASTPSTEVRIDGNSSVYIYSAVEIPVGIGSHISFKYKTDGLLKIHPYIADHSACDYDLDTLNQFEDFQKAFDFNNEVTEVYNAFEITNNASTPVNLKLTDIMVYINHDAADVIGSYRGFQTVQERALYTASTNIYTTADSTDAVSASSSTATSTFPVNAGAKTGLIQVDFDVVIENLTGATLDSLTIGYNCSKDQSGTAVVGTISTVDYTEQASIHVSRVLDPAYDHATYDVDNSYLTDVIVTTEVTASGSWTADVKLKNFKLTQVELKTDFYVEGSLSLIHVDNEMPL